MKRIIKAGTTSNVFHIFISDNSKTDGSGLAGLVYNSSGLSAYYIRPGQTAATAITLASITTLGTFVSGGFKEIDSTNMPGWYEFDPPDAAIATGAPSCSIHLKGATNMAPLPIEIQLDINTAADTYSRLGAPLGASVSADIAAVKTDTGNNYSLLTNGTYGLAQLTRSTTPANTLAIDSSGRVTVGSNNDKTGYSLSGNVTVGGYAAGQDPATYILSTPANKLTTNGSGFVSQDLTQTVPSFTGKPSTVGALLYFIRQNAQNKLDYNKSTNNMVLYEDDGVTAKLTFAMSDTSTDAIRGAGA